MFKRLGKGLIIVGIDHFLVNSDNNFVVVVNIYNLLYYNTVDTFCKSLINNGVDK